MAVPRMLLHAMQDLDQNDFGDLKWYLTDGLDKDRRIAKSHLENAKETDTVRVMVKNYGEYKAVAVTMEILRMMRNNNDADKLERKYREITNGRPNGAPPAAAGAPPAAAAGAPPAAAGAPPAAAGAPPAAAGAPPAAPGAPPAAPGAPPAAAGALPAAAPGAPPVAPGAPPAAYAALPAPPGPLPAAPVTVTADQNSRVIAPMFTNTSIGNMNISIK